MRSAKLKTHTLLYEYSKNLAILPKNLSTEQKSPDFCGVAKQTAAKKRN
jgi:hypothetical protein